MFFVRVRRGANSGNLLLFAMFLGVQRFFLGVQRFVQNNDVVVYAGECLQAAHDYNAKYILEFVFDYIRMFREYYCELNIRGTQHSGGCHSYPKS